ncbi:MAG: EAP30/Vps36 family vacuolar-sorting protein [Candidatus Baldrarchaeia archaeon]
MGLHEIEKKLKMNAAFKQKRLELMLTELEMLMQGMRDLSQKLEEFEEKYGDIISLHPEYRKKIEDLKRELGISPVVEKVEKPSFWERLRGKGPFYNTLAMKILRIALPLAKKTGGILTLAELLTTLTKKFPTMQIKTTDVLKALNVLKEEGLIADVRKLKSGVVLIEVLPVELSNDQHEVLSLASDKGWVTLDEVLLKTGWTQERARRVLKELENSGIAVFDPNYAKGGRWFFPGLKSASKASSSP